MAPQASATNRHPPQAVYRLRTARLELRCWSPTDAPALVQAIQASREHLLPWLPWMMHEPESAQAKARRLAGFRSQFDRGRELIYGLFEPATGKVIGSLGLHDRIGAGAREIGYWIAASHARQGLMTEAVAAIVRLGFETLDLKRMEIHCDPRNLASAGVPRKLGFALQTTLLGSVIAASMAPRDSQIWALTTQQYPNSPAVAARFKAWNLIDEERTFE